MKNFCIFMRAGFYRPSDHTISIGGVQTYVYDLARLALSLGYAPLVVEMNNDGREARYELDGIQIQQVSVPGKHYFQRCFDRVYRHLAAPGNIYVIATDQLSIRCMAPGVVAIQHGIAFDEPIDKWYAPALKMLKCWRNVQRVAMVPHMVCVDYNFYNWYRTLSTVTPRHTLTVIPNYAQGCISEAELSEKLARTRRRRVLFARRFVEHRGALLFAAVARRLLREFPDVEITFAGRGPLEERLRALFGGDARVVFTTYEARESLSFHRQYDISVIPTVYSEGTSLSLCEAMSAGCYCVASHVGGMTNILLDGFNGRLVPPEEAAVYEALREAMVGPEAAFRDVCRNAYLSARTAFSKEKWQSRWTRVIQNLADDERA